MEEQNQNKDYLMRLLISIIDWEYPLSEEEIQPRMWNLRDKKTLRDLILAYGNGIILELRAEGETEDALRMLRGIVIGAGSSSKIELSSEEKQSLWLCQEGDECYRQPTRNGGYTFINPIPQPHKFSESN